MKSLKKILIKLYAGLIKDKRKRKQIREILFNLDDNLIILDKNHIPQKFNDYVEVIEFDCWGDSFKNYLINHNMPEKMKNLKRGLDEKSITVIDNKVEHFLNLPTKFKWAPHFRVDSRKILYTDEELKESEKFLKALPLIKEKYKGNFNNYYLPEVFFYHHGLKFCPNSVQKYIKNKAFVDVGAFYGDSTIVMNEYNPSKIFAFEMQPSLIKIMEENIKANNIDSKNVSCINAGVSNINDVINVADNEFCSN